jgi:predicted nucleotidyltransferase
MNKIKLNDNLKTALETIVNEITKDVKWSLWAGVGAYFYGSGRKPTDIDMITRYSDMQMLTNCLNDFIIMQPKIIEKDIFRVPLAKFKISDYEVEACSDMIINVEGKKYSFKYDEEMINKIREIKVGAVKIPVTSPEDIIILKAISQRGIERGKYDIEDIKGILANQKIDWNYLKKRTQDTKSYNRVSNLLGRLGYAKMI